VRGGTKNDEEVGMTKKEELREKVDNVRQSQKGETEESVIGGDRSDQ